MLKLNSLFFLLLSQLCVVGVFGFTENSFYVINQEQNLCGEFTRGNSISANWLLEDWEAIFLIPDTENDFLSDRECLDGNVGACCNNQGYRYAGVPIGSEHISDERKGAEILAGKGVIQTKSFNPSQYNLDQEISRKEMMKIVMNMSDFKVENICREIFSDVSDGWACKYIESALEHEIITGNQQFRPDDSVTKTEALKLIFKARSIDKAYNTDYWQEDYVSTAYYHGYIDEKYKNYNEYATRGWIFSLSGKTFK